MASRQRETLKNWFTAITNVNDHLQMGSFVELKPIGRRPSEYNLNWRNPSHRLCPFFLTYAVCLRLGHHRAFPAEACLGKVDNAPVVILTMRASCHGSGGLQSTSNN